MVGAGQALCVTDDGDACGGRYGPVRLRSAQWIGHHRDSGNEETHAELVVPWPDQEAALVADRLRLPDDGADSMFVSCGVAFGLVPIRLGAPQQLVLVGLVAG